ncbi:MAG TPA: DUF6370 family protein [Chthoniobacteraceae bacterium]|nr:DUF6370 family protein [Chthoniobacteraceae bacterium]
MKKLALVTTLLAVLALPALAETLQGEATCAKCTLKQADKCQFALTVEKDGKKETYLAEQNDVAKKFHETICKDTVKVKVEGAVAEKDGKKTITLAKVEEVK